MAVAPAANDGLASAIEDESVTQRANIALYGATGAGPGTAP